MGVILTTAHMQFLAENSACGGGFDWATSVPDLYEGWQVCPQGDWLLWFTVQLHAEPRAVVKAALGCSRLALPYVKDNEPRAREAHDMVESWLKAPETGDPGRLNGSIKATDAAWIEAQMDGNLAGAAAVKSAGCLVKALLLMEKGRNRASQFMMKTGTWVAEAAAAQAEAEGVDAEATRKAMHHQCAEVVRETFSTDTIHALIRRHIEQRHEPAES